MYSRILLLVLLNAFFIGAFLMPAYAASEGVPDDDTALIKQSKNLQILCSESVQHVPDMDVEYAPGIDAQGNFIVAPDVGFISNKLSYPIDIPIELDMLDRLKMNAPAGIVSDPLIAGLKIYDGGKIEYNGRDVSGDVERFCMNALGIDKNDINTATEADNDGAKDGEIIAGEHH